MTNTFKIISDKAGEVNAIANGANELVYWSTGYAYASYITIMNGGRRADKKAELVEYNDNIDNGELYATYKIKVSEEEFAYGITEIGFSPYQGATPCAVSSVSVPPSSLTVYATVKLVLRGDVMFYPGENPLVRSLLGMEKRPDLNVKGNVHAVPDSVKRVGILAYQPIESEAVYEDGECSLTFSSNGYSDFLIVGPTTCARYDLCYNTTETKTVIEQCKGGFYADRAVDISRVYNDSGDINFVSYHCPCDFLASDKTFSEDFTGYELFTDPTFKYLGLRNGTDYYLVDPETCVVTKGGAYQNKIMLTSDGNAISTDQGQFTFHREQKTINVYPGKAEVFYRDGGYDILIYSVNTMLYYRYQDGSSQRVEIYNTIAGAELTRLNDFSVVLKLQNLIRFFSKDGEFPFQFDTENLTDTTIKDGCFYGDGYMGNLFSGEKMDCDKQLGKFCLYKGYLYYVGEGGIKNVGYIGDADSVAQAGDYLFVLRNGTLQRFFMLTDGMYASLPYTGEVSAVEKHLGSPDNRTVTLTLKR